MKELPVLELKDYPIGLLENIIKTKGKEATDRKLKSYGYGFSSDNGTGRNRIYTITSLPDSFHQFRYYCVFSLGLSPNMRFEKFRDFIYLFLGDEDFNWRPDEQKEEYTRLLGRGITRQTIAKYTSILDRLGYVVLFTGDFVYYKVYKDAKGFQKQEIIEKEEYSAAWKLYWNYKDEHPEKGSRYAYAVMYERLGGVPRKQRKPDFNAWYKDELSYLLELATNSILDEVSDQ